MSLDFYIIENDEDELFWKNITHNLTPMWHKAEVFDALYNSDGKRPKEIIETLRTGLLKMQQEPAEYRKLESPNKWGNYQSAVCFLTEVIDACQQYDGIIHILK